MLQLGCSKIRFFRLLASLRTQPIDLYQIVKNAQYFDILRSSWRLAPVRILPRFQFAVIFRMYYTIRYLYWQTNYVFIFPEGICQAPVIWWHLIIIEPPVSAIKVSPASIKGWVSAEMVARASSLHLCLRFEIFHCGFAILFFWTQIGRKIQN